MEGVSLCVAARLNLQFRRTADKGIQSENLLYSCINHLQGCTNPIGHMGHSPAEEESPTFWRP